MTVAPRWKRPAALAAVLICLCAGVGPLHAQVLRQFSVRFTTDARGDIAVIGNKSLDCPDADANCAAARAGLGPSLDNNDFGAPVYVDIDGDPSTFNSSEATLAIPAGGSVLWAGLYWSGDYIGGVAPPDSTQRDRVRLQTPGSGYVTVVATRLDDLRLSSPERRYFQGFADVTSLVQSGGSGGYRVADIQAALGGNRYGGWALVVVLGDPAQRPRNLTVFDGWARVNSVTAVDLNLSGFVTPPLGAFAARFAHVSWEGDLGQTGDDVRLNGLAITDGLNVAGNVLNSTISRLGTLVTAKNPNHVNQFGVDIDYMDITGILPNGTTTAAVNFSSAGDDYLPGVVAFVIEEAAEADVSVAKTGPATVGPLGTVTYDVTVQANGPNPAGGIVVTDTLPPGFTFVSATGGGTASGGVVTWPAIAVLPIGASQSYSVTATAPATGTLTNIAAASSLIPDPFPGNNDGSGAASRVATTIVDTADVVATKSGAAAVSSLDTLSYTVQVHNQGPSPAANVTVTDTLPGGVTFVSATGGGSFAGGVVTWPAIPTLASGASQSFTVVAVAPATGTLTNVVASTSTTPDPVASNNDGSAAAARVVTIVAPTTDLVVTKAGPTVVTVGSGATYTVTVRNQGSVVASNVRVTDTLPALFPFASASGGGTHLAGVVSWPLIPSLGPGASQSFTVTVTTPTIGSATNLAAASSPTAEANPSDNDGSAPGSRVTTVVTAAPEPDVAVTKTGPGTVALGGSLIYTVTVTNLGTLAATQVIVTDTLPFGATFVSANGGGTLSGSVVTWPAIATLAPGASQAFTVLATASSVGTLVNVAAGSATSPDADPGNNNGTAATSRVVTTVAGTADLVTTKTGPSAVVAGATITYTVTVRNLGPAPAASVALRDTLPAGVGFVSASGGGTLAGNVVSWPTIPSLAPGASASFNLVATAPLTTGTITNLAAATTTTPDPTPGNNDGSAAASRVVTQVVSTADVSVAKSGPSTATVGTPFSYSIAVRNDGPGSATAVSVTDTLPSGIEFVSASAGGTLSGRVVSWPTIASIANGATQTFTVTARILAAGVYTNVAAASAVSSDPNPGNNNGTGAQNRVVTSVAGQADLMAAKTGPATVDAGVTFDYTIVVGNAGPDTAIAVVVTDTLPAAVGFVSASDGGQVAGRVVQWPAIARLAPDAEATYTVTVRAPVAGSFTNVVAATSAFPDPDPANNNGSSPAARPTTNVRPVDLAIAKTHVGDLAIGAIARYDLVVTNVGAVTTTGPVTVLDTLPAGLAVRSASGTGWSCTTAGQVVSCRYDQPIAPGATAGIGLEADVLPAAAPAVVNRAYVSTEGDDLPIGNNVATDGAPVSSTSPLVIEKRALRTEVEIGDVVGYEIVVSNLAGGSLSGVAVVDTLPLGFRYLSGSTRVDGGVVADPAGAPGPVLTIPIASLGGNASVSVRYDLRVGPAAPAGSGTNRAFARAEPSGLASPLVAAQVRFRAGLLDDRAIIVGRIVARFDSAGQRRTVGIPGVRMVLSDGSAAITDGEGRYSFYGLAPLPMVVKVDSTTLPAGVRLAITGSRQVGRPGLHLADLKRGELHRADFVGDLVADGAALAAIRARRDGPVTGPGGESTGEPIVSDRPVSTPPAASGIGRDRGDSIPIRGVYQSVTGASSAPIAERNGVALVRLADRPVEPPPNADRLEVSVPNSPVPADGSTQVAIRVRLLAADGTPKSSSVPITLEASLGRWQAVDRDPVEPGVQTALEDGVGTFGLVAPLREGAGEVRVTSGVASQEALIAFVPAARPLMAAGLIQGRLDFTSLTRGAIVAARPDDGFEQELRDLSATSADSSRQGGARGALYLKGKIRGDYLLTVAFDSERDPDARLNRDIRPEEFYPVYGDESIREFDARSAERLYVRIDKERSYFLYGDYSTPSATEAKELGAYLRTLTGATQHFESENARVEAFVARTESRQVVDELPGRGISGPYALSQAEALANSERVELVTRDRNQPSRILRLEPMRRWVDYTVEPFTGRLLFRRPVPSIDGDLNPVSIRVSYELASGGDARWVYGGDASLRLGRRVELGGTVVQEEDPLDSFTMFGLNAALKLGKGTTIQGELARTNGNSRDPGSAGRVELRHHAGRFDLHAFGIQSDSAFDNPSSTFPGGRRDLGGRVSLGVTPSTRLIGHALRTEDRRTAARRDGALLGVEQSVGELLRLEVGYRYGREQGGPATPGTEGATPNETNAAHGRLSLELGDTVAAGLKRLRLFGEYDQDLRESDQRRGAVGAELQAMRRLRLYARHEFLSSFAGPFALNNEQRSSATVFGADGGYAEDGQVFSEVRSREGLAGRDAEAVIGLRNRWRLAAGLSLDATFERVHPIEGASTALTDATAVTGAIDYSTNPDWRATARVEFRDAADTDTWLGSIGYAHKLSRDWTFLGRALWSDLGLDRVRGRGQVGLAWRQTRSGRWNGLARVERTLERLGAAQTGRLKRAVTLASAHANWQATGGLVVSGRWSSKWATDSTGPVEYASRADLGLLRLVQDIGSRLDLGVQGSGLRASEGGTRFGVGGELGVRVAAGLRLGVGYNVFGFRDRDLRDTEYTLEGAYLRFEYVFDEDLLKALARR